VLLSALPMLMFLGLFLFVRHRFRVAAREAAQAIDKVDAVRSNPRFTTLRFCSRAEPPASTFLLAGGTARFDQGLSHDSS